MTSIRFGDVQVTRVEEMPGPGLEPQVPYPDWTSDALERHRASVPPRHFDETQSRFVSSVHRWMVRSRHPLARVDSCAGNGKQRPAFPRFRMRNVPLLDRLRAAGAHPEDMEVVARSNAPR